MSDFSLMDAIGGIVTLGPEFRGCNIPPARNARFFRNLWETLSGKMPKKAEANQDRSTAQPPFALQTALKPLFFVLHY